MGVVEFFARALRAQFDNSAPLSSYATDCDSIVLGTDCELDQNAHANKMYIGIPKKMELSRKWSPS